MMGDVDEMDFRKADFGIIPNYDNAGAYRTDNNDHAYPPFYILEDGDNQWKTLKSGNDGCFGAAQNTSVKGFTGYLAFPIKYMHNPEDKIATEDTVVTGIFFYCSLAEEGMTDDFAYIGNIELVEDYRIFD